jgi:hypothetical protein
MNLTQRPSIDALIETVRAERAKLARVEANWQGVIDRDRAKGARGTTRAMRLARRWVTEQAATVSASERALLAAVMGDK